MMAFHITACRPSTQGAKMSCIMVDCGEALRPQHLLPAPLDFDRRHPNIRTDIKIRKTARSVDRAQNDTTNTHNSTGRDQSLYFPLPPQFQSILSTYTLHDFTLPLSSPNNVLHMEHTSTPPRLPYKKRHHNHRPHHFNSRPNDCTHDTTKRHHACPRLWR